MPKLFMFSLPVLHRQILGDQPVLPYMRCAATQDQAAVEHKVTTFIGIFRFTARACALYYT